MQAKLNAENQLTLPKAVISAFPGVERFDVTQENGRIILTPIRIAQADPVRDKLAELQLTGQDIADAVAWARQN